MLKDSIQKLSKLVPGSISFDEADLKKHCSELFYISDYPPSAIYYPETEDHVIYIVNLCLEYRIPIIPYGAGTSVEGHTAAIEGGLCLDMSRMNQVLEFSREDSYVSVQPGIAYNELNDFLKPHGFHFPVEAAWGATIGGMMATNASGAGAVDAGAMLKNVVNCTVVTCQDEKVVKIHTGTKAPKSSAGYNLTGLFIGSEGTLGVITQIGLKIRRNFDAGSTICCQFNEIETAIEFVTHMHGKIQFRRIELLDKLQTDACIAYSQMHLLNNGLHTLIIELAGNKLAVAEEASIVEDWLRDNSAINVQVYRDKQSAEHIWKMRKFAAQAAIQYIDKNKSVISTDVSVPISKLAQCINACYKHMHECGIKAPVVAHVGDGNFHFVILVNPEDRNELENARHFSNLVVDEALKVGGTCTGEHGIGLGKINYLLQEHSSSIAVMNKIKKMFDSCGIFNPKKILNE